MIKKVLMVACALVVAALIVWLWRAGMLKGIYGILMAAVGLFAGGAIERQAKLKKVRRDIEEARAVIRAQEKDIQEMRKRHDEEVRQVEEAGSDATFDDLLASANDRERRRKAGHMGE